MILFLTSLDIRSTTHKSLPSLFGSDTTSSISEKCLFSMLNAINCSEPQCKGVHESSIDCAFCDVKAERGKRNYNY